MHRQDPPVLEQAGTTWFTRPGEQPAPESVDVPEVAAPVPSQDTSTSREEELVRITPVTGDLPAIVTAPPPPVRSADAPPAAPATAPVAQTTAADTDADAAADHRHPPTPKPFFDPPLIAQRAVLGLPTGFLIADFARSQGITYAAASAAVDRELPRPVG